MAGIDHHPVAAAGHHRQALRGEGAPGQQGPAGSIGTGPHRQRAGNRLEITLAGRNPQTRGPGGQIHPPAIPGGAH